jgi:hypothetical protein
VGRSDEPLWAVLQGRWGDWGQPRADVSAAQVPVDAWQRLSAGQGAKGPRWYDWARVRLARLQLTLEERRWDHWLLVRRSRSDPTELAYYVVCAPAGTALRTLARVAGERWRIEHSCELAKGEVGLDEYEVRRWDGWYRHMTLAMCALAYLAVLRAHLCAPQEAPPAPRPPRTTTQKAQVAKGALSAADRFDRGPLTADGARDPPCALDPGAGHLSTSRHPGAGLVAVATTSPGAGQALPLPAPSRPRPTLTATVKVDSRYPGERRCRTPCG